MSNKKCFLLDVMPLLYRAHFATIGKHFGTTTGIDTRTTLVFYNYIFQVITEEKPDAIAAALDSKPKGRVAVSSVYKANREKMPSEISDAFPYALKLLEALNIPVLKEEGYEADDIIATVSRQASNKGYKVFIVSPDKDFAQMVTDRIFLFRPAYKGATMETLDVEGVKNKYGVAPGQIADYLALRGDSVDNIIGIKGIGDKTAAQLLADHASIEKLVENAENIKQSKVKEAVLEYKEQLLENKQLALLTGDVEMSVDWEKLEGNKPDESKLLPLLDELQFARIKERLAKLDFIKPGEVSPIGPQKQELPIVSLKLNEAIKIFKQIKQVAVAFLEQYQSKFFMMPVEKKEVYEITLDNDVQWKELIELLDVPELTKWGWELKALLKKISSTGMDLRTSWIDLSLAAYLLESDAKIEWLYIRDKYQLTEYQLQGDLKDLNYLPSLFDAYEKIMRKVAEMGLTDLYFKIELPLQSVITRMELHGIRIDEDTLKEIDKVLTRQLNELEKKLYQQAGRKFNIGSPSQTADILQNICDPSELKKTKTGQISTAEPFLIDIAPKYPFIADLLEYRKLNKIITTYVYSLPKYIDAVTKKIHPTFQQVVAGTGRLSCTDPNLQNLPIRSEAGREVRKAIIPSGPEFSILSVDYNQVELRLLAALSGDKVMVETFKSGKDIHTTTASRIFDVPDDNVTKDMRSKAKGVNFGIAYGITPWGLATRLKISQKEAREIIDAYFEDFSSVKEYLERSINETRERGYTRTQYGRIRYIEGIDSRNGTTRKIAERMAVNAPLQGLAADVIKEAMVNIDEFIANQHLRSRMILQVHDELVFDAADDELQILIPRVIQIMETNAKFIVPLKVNVSVGKNWLDQFEYQ